jgi:hypothetical protein
LTDEEIVAVGKMIDSKESYIVSWADEGDPKRSDYRHILQLSSNGDASVQFLNNLEERIKASPAFSSAERAKTIADAVNALHSSVSFGKYMAWGGIALTVITATVQVLTQIRQFTKSMWLQAFATLTGLDLQEKQMNMMEAQMNGGVKKVVTPLDQATDAITRELEGIKSKGGDPANLSKGEKNRIYEAVKVVVTAPYDKALQRAILGKDKKAEKAAKEELAPKKVEKEINALLKDYVQKTNANILEAVGGELDKTSDKMLEKITAEGRIPTLADTDSLKANVRTLLKERFEVALQVGEMANLDSSITGPLKDQLKNIDTTVSEVMDGAVKRELGQGKLRLAPDLGEKVRKEIGADAKMAEQKFSLESDPDHAKDVAKGTLSELKLSNFWIFGESGDGKSRTMDAIIYDAVTGKLGVDRNGYDYAKDVLFLGFGIKEMNTEPPVDNGKGEKVSPFAYKGAAGTYYAGLRQSIARARLFGQRIVLVNDELGDTLTQAHEVLLNAKTDMTSNNLITMMGAMTTDKADELKNRGAGEAKGDDFVQFFRRGRGLTKSIAEPSDLVRILEWNAPLLEQEMGVTLDDSARAVIAEMAKNSKGHPSISEALEIIKKTVADKKRASTVAASSVITITGDEIRSAARRILETEQQRTMATQAQAHMKEINRKEETQRIQEELDTAYPQGNAERKMALTRTIWDVWNGNRVQNERIYTGGIMEFAKVYAVSMGPTMGLDRPDPSEEAPGESVEEVASKLREELPPMFRESRYDGFLNATAQEIVSQRRANPSAAERPIEAVVQVAASDISRRIIEDPSMVERLSVVTSETTTTRESRIEVVGAGALRALARGAEMAGRIGRER